MNDPPSSYSFGLFNLDCGQRLLLRVGKPVPLAPKAVETLIVLVEGSGRLITKEDLMKRVWPDTFVEEGNLSRNVHLLRKVLGKGPGGQEYIETIPRRGYRFNGDVVELRRELESPPPAQHLASRSAASEMPSAVSGDPLAGEMAAPMPTSVPVTPIARLEAKRANPLLQAAGAVAVLAAVIVIWVLLRSKHAFEPGQVHAGLRSIAVLPLKSLSPDAGYQYLGLGMADALITRLGSIREAVVRPVEAVRRYAAEEPDPFAAGRALKVDIVIDGSIQRIGDRMRVTVRALRVADGVQLWAGEFNEKISDMFAIEDSISTKVAGALALKLTRDEQQQLSRSYTTNSDAYQLYLKGRFFWNKRTDAGLEQSIDDFQQAIKLDPNFALAYSGLADSYMLTGSYGYGEVAPRQAMSKAKAAAERALALDDSLAEAHASLAFAALNYDWDWPSAEKEFQSALNLSPNSAGLHHWFSHYLVVMGRMPEALAESRRALELSPTDVVINEHLAWCELMARQYDRAVQQCHETLQMNPNFVQARRVLGLAYLYSGRYSQAIAQFQGSVKASASSPVTLALLAQAYALSGQKPQAKVLLAKLLDLSKKRYVSAAAIAVIEADLGEKNSAFQWLDKAYQERSNSLIYLKADPQFDGLRSDPRFAQLLRRMGLSP